MNDGLIELGDARVLVTGGSMGIGLAAARACLAAGARIAICARSASSLDEAAAALATEAPGRVQAIVADVTDAQQVDAALAMVDRVYGPINAVIHAAGVYGPIGPVTEVDPAEWLDALRINLFGTMLVCRQACRRMRRTGGGRIALFAGGGGASPFPSFTSYASAKAGVVRFAETIALEMAPHDIAVNAVAPGFVMTRFHEQTLAAGPELAGKAFYETTRRQADSGGVPAAIGARCAAFLVSPAAVGITGRFVAAPYDGYMDWPVRRDAIAGSDLFTLRRIVPRDRGGEWQ